METNSCLNVPTAQCHVQKPRDITQVKTQRVQTQPAASLHDQSQDGKTQAEKKVERKRDSWWSVGNPALRMEAQEETRLCFFWMVTTRTIVYCVFCWRVGTSEGKRRLNGWLEAWDRGSHCGAGVAWGPLSALEALSEQVVAVVALFWASGGRKKGGRARTAGHVQRPGVGTEWCYTHTIAI